MTSRHLSSVTGSSIGKTLRSTRRYAGVSSPSKIWRGRCLRSIEAIEVDAKVYAILFEELFRHWPLVILPYRVIIGVLPTLQVAEQSPGCIDILNPRGKFPLINN